MNLLRFFLLLFFGLFAVTVSAQTSTSDNLNATVLLETGEYTAQRQGQFLVVSLKKPHRVLSTSSVNGGESTTIQYLVNHQSMEAVADNKRFKQQLALSRLRYHEKIAKQLSLPAKQMVLMGTAANIQQTALVQQQFKDLTVTAFVTAGVKGNAQRAGDPTRWYQTPQGNKRQADPKIGSNLDFDKRTQDPISSPSKDQKLNFQIVDRQILDNQGTINIVLLVNKSLSAGAQVKVAMLVTEAKSAALAELSIASQQSSHLATGTGTDQLIVASTIQLNATPLESASGHLKLGEMVGTVVRDAVLKALRWQNKLEPSKISNVIHALQRFGLDKTTLLAGMRPYLLDSDFQLASKNVNALTNDLRLTASAYAFATLLDKHQYGVLSPTAMPEILRDQAAQVAVAISANPAKWGDFWGALSLDVSAFTVNNKQNFKSEIKLFSHAVALGWKNKWEDKTTQLKVTELKGTQLSVVMLHMKPTLATNIDDIDANMKQIESAMRQAKKQGARWVMTPELSLTGYKFQSKIGTDWIKQGVDRWTKHLQKVADELDVVLFLSHLEKSAETKQTYNTLFVINRQGEIIARHHKMNTIPVSEAWSSKGTKNTLVTVDGVKVGLLICADAWPKTHTQYLKDKGADLIVSSANWAPGEYGPGQTWEQRSSESGLPIFVNNRMGKEDSLDMRKAASVVVVPVADKGKRVLEYRHADKSSHTTRDNMVLIHFTFDLKSNMLERINH